MFGEKGFSCWFKWLSEKIYAWENGNGSREIEVISSDYIKNKQIDEIIWWNYSNQIKEIIKLELSVIEIEGD